MNESTCGNSGHSRDQVATVASRDGVCIWRNAGLIGALAAAHHAGVASYLVPSVILLVLGAAASFILWRQQRRRP